MVGLAAIHGIEMAARAFVQAGAERLCVAGLDEALHLRASGISAPILVLFAVPPEAAPQAAAAAIELSASDERTALETVGLVAVEDGPPLRLHLEVETGLARAGLRAERLAAVARRIAETPRTELVGLWSHLASPHDAAFTRGQLDEFERAAAALREAGLVVPARHLAASGGLLGGAVPAYEGVRPGLMLYGLAPAGLAQATSEAAELAQGLRPAMSLKARPLRVEELAPGSPVGYGGHWRAERHSRIATLPVGYGDGWSRSYSPGGQAIVRGRRVPLVGTVAMDAIMVDVTDVPGVDPGDEFVLLGEQAGESITVDELARLRNTISWEIVTTMAQRVPRVYHAGSVLLALRTLGGEVRSSEQRGVGAGSTVNET
jgi:alanine racemase